MLIILNGEERDIPESTSCRQFLSGLTGRTITGDGLSEDGRPLGIALAVDGAIVPRGTWDRTRLAEGARVEIVTAVQGG